MGVERTPVQRTAVASPEHFPFGVDFQKMLLRLLMEDQNLMMALSKFLKPSYFESEVLAWAYGYVERYHKQYGSSPSPQVLLEQTRGLDPRIRPLYTAVIEQVRDTPYRDEQWLRDNVLDFIKRGIFVQAFNEARELYNVGKTTQAYDSMMARLTELSQVAFEPLDREWFFEQLPHRQSQRLADDHMMNRIGTGFGTLDRVLQGGLPKGEMGIWIGYAKGGKSTMLTQHGVAATRRCMRKVLHFVFEGSRKQVGDRYDAAFTRELYQDVKFGKMSAEAYRMAMLEFQYLRHKLVIRGFTDDWSYSITNVHQEMTDLKRSHGWTPDMVIIDYGDLIAGREKHYRSETEKQTASYRDMKSLANRGFALWTASQAQRPEEGSEDTPHLIRSRDIATTYEKVRVADYIGSINQTLAERKSKIARLFYELYRDNQAGAPQTVYADFERMLIREEGDLVSPHAASAAAAAAPTSPPMGYVSVPMTQTTAKF